MANDKLAELNGGQVDNYASILVHFEEGLNKNPHGPALIAMHQSENHLSEMIGNASSNDPNGGNCLVWSHQQLHSAARKLAFGLHSQGIQPGSTLMTLIPNRAEWALLWLASVILRVTIVSLDFGALNVARCAELQGYLKTLKPAAVVVSAPADTQAVDNAIEAIGMAKPLKLILDPSRDLADWVSFLDVAMRVKEDTVLEENLLEQARVPNPDHIAFIVFTSGTSSGTPKGCPRHVASATSVLNALDPMLRMDENSRLPLVSANFRIIAPSLAMNTWKSGGAVVMPGPSFNPQSCLDAIEQHGGTHLLLVPALLHAIANDPSFDSRNLAAVKYAWFGGDIITKDIVAKAHRVFPDARLAGGHGMSEGAGIFEWPFIDSEDEFSDTGGICPVGSIAPGSKIRIWDVEQGCVAEKGAVGELHICSPGLIKHYLGGADEEAFYEDETGRWLKTGDSAMVTKDEIVYILGRLSQSFKRAGIRMIPGSLESCIDAYTGSQSSVIGMPHSTLGHEPWAVVKNLEGKTTSQIEQQVVDLFGKDYALGGAVSLQQLGMTDFPLNATGKIMKITLQDEISKYQHR